MLSVFLLVWRINMFMKHAVLTSLIDKTLKYNTNKRHIVLHVSGIRTYNETEAAVSKSKETVWC